MNFHDLANKRYSVRSYQETPVKRQQVEKCIEAARLAPSACNAQPWKIVVIDEPGLKNVVANTAFGATSSFNYFARQSPVIALIVSEKQKFTAKIGGLILRRDYRLMDIGIAAEHFCLQATELGLGTCMIGWFKQKKVKKILSIPRYKRIELLITLGYPASDEIPPKSRKPSEDIKVYNEYK